LFCFLWEKKVFALELINSNGWDFRKVKGLHFLEKFQEGQTFQYSMMMEDYLLKHVLPKFLEDNYFSVFTFGTPDRAQNSQVI